MGLAGPARVGAAAPPLFDPTIESEIFCYPKNIFETFFKYLKSGIVIIYSTETSQYSNFSTILQKILEIKHFFIDLII